MRRLLLTIALGIVLTLPFAVTLTVSAQNPIDPVCDANTEESPLCDVTGEKDPITGSEGVILRVVEMFSYIVGFSAVLMMILAGLRFITAGGNSESVAAARNTVIWALVGVAIFLSSQVIVRFIISSV